MWGVWGLRRRSHSSTHRNRYSDPLDDLVNESRHTALQPNPLVRSGPVVRRSSALDDLRKWAPGGREAPRDTAGRHARIVHKAVAPKVVRGPGGKPLRSAPRVAGRWFTASPRFAEARKTFICFKRKVRREVLHALKRTRSGKGGSKKRNQWSDIQCRT